MLKVCGAKKRQPCLTALLGQVAPSLPVEISVRIRYFGMLYPTSVWFSPLSSLRRGGPSSSAPLLMPAPWRFQERERG